MKQSIYKKEQLFPVTLHQWLVVSCAFSVLLLLVRIMATGYFAFLFLPWNLFLAFIPYAISHWLYNNPGIRENKFKLAVMVSLWLLFIPNTFYILTDLFHLDHFEGPPKWFDLLLLLSFAWNGLLFGIISLRRMEMILEELSGKGFSLFIVFAVMMLNSFGIYIGRFLRFNSWDVIAQPFSLFGEILEIIFHPFANKMEWGMIVCYAIFMTLLYVTIKKLAENFNPSISKK